MKLKRKLDHIYWFLIMILPILLILVYGRNAQITSITDLITMIGTILPTSDTLKTAIVKVFEIFNWVNDYTQIVAQMAAYFVYMAFVKIMIDLVLVLINVANKYIDRAIGG